MFHLAFPAQYRSAVEQEVHALCLHNTMGAAAPLPARCLSELAVSSACH